MKYQRTMPTDDQKGTFKICSEGEHKFQIIDIFSESDEKIVIKCESLNDQATILHSVSNDPSNRFFWLTKLFLKCIGEPHNGDVVIDTDAWIGRQFIGKVVHTAKNGNTYANIREMIYKEIDQHHIIKNNDKVTDPSQIAWND